MWEQQNFYSASKENITDRQLRVSLRTSIFKKMRLAFLSLGLDR